MSSAKTPMNQGRRRFLTLAASSALLAGCGKLRRWGLPITVHVPGMAEGHWLRDHKTLPTSSGDLRTQVAILGSGIAGLTTAWKLAKEGYTDFILLSGPEFGGNAAGGNFGDLAYPRGAHYLPLPSMESIHVREMLHDFGVILADPMAEKPYFDEAALIHSPEDRLFKDGQWHEGLLPSSGVSADEQRQQQRFFALVETLKHQRGSDGKKLFAIPLELSSTDPQWRSLDALNFKQWLQNQGYNAPSLHWYLNYACRDDYGADYDKISAWAGLHYFASRGGKARNAEEGAVLTWPDGLQTLVRKLEAAIRKPRTGIQSRIVAGFAVKVKEQSDGVTVLCASSAAANAKTFTIHAQKVVCAMPLFVAAHVVEGILDLGFDSVIHQPSHAPWLISNFLLDGFPPEIEGPPLAWDNVVYGGKGLGYVVSTHQLIRTAQPAQTIFSAYQALSQRSPTEIRKWLNTASAETLYEEASGDLRAVYGWRWPRYVKSLEITVRGHAMASPTPGFLSNVGLNALRNATGRIQFAHADLSGLSVFEEASWWGYKAALRILDEG